MRKLSKIDESSWGDMRKRSSGEIIRRENDVNLLDRDGLYDYLTSHYKNTNSFDPIYNSETFNTIKVPFLIQGGSDGVYLSFEENEVSIPYSSPYKVKGLFSKLADEFSLKTDSKTGHSWYIISPKDGSEVTNTFFIYVIDFLLDNIPDSFEKGVKKIIEESTWGDMRKRSAGNQIRKEDDINNLDGDGLTDYLKKHYEPLNAYAVITYVANIISVPIIRDHTNSCIMFNCKTKTIGVTNDIMDQVRGLLRVMENNFSIETFEGEDGNGEYKVYTILPKDGSEVTNKFFIEVIDFLLYHIPGHLYNKSIQKIDDKS